MQITAKGHWSGDPATHCGELTLVADKQSEAALIAHLYRLFQREASRSLRLQRIAGIAEQMGENDTGVVSFRDVKRELTEVVANGEHD